MLDWDTLQIYLLLNRQASTESNIAKNIQTFMKWNMKAQNAEEQSIV